MLSDSQQKLEEPVFDIPERMRHVLRPTEVDRSISLAFRNVHQQNQHSLLMRTELLQTAFLNTADNYLALLSVLTSVPRHRHLHHVAITQTD